MRHLVSTLLCALTALAALPAAAQKPVELTFYYPVSVGGPITKIFDDMVADFHRENPDVRVTPVYAGTYQDAVAKALTAHRGGNPPQMAVLLSTDMFTLIDEDAIVPIDGLLKTDEDKQWLNGFYDAFMQNSRAEGHVWGVPFQRSTIVMYYNKDLFKEAGLDPDKAPGTWTELVETAKKLTKRDAAGNVTQWGVSIPSTAFGYWLFQALTIPNDATLANAAGTEVYFDAPAVVETLQYWRDLSAKHQVMPGGTIDWGTTPRDFLEQKAAIIWSTTGNLTNIRANAKFPFGVAMVPHAKRGGSPTGGGNLFIFKQTSPVAQQAALRFARWVTQPERAAAWGMATGYVAVTPAAWETEKMRQYVQDFPYAAVARDQLAISAAEFATHDSQRISKLLGDAIQAALIGAKTPEQALKDAQRDAERVLRRYR